MAPKWWTLLAACTATFMLLLDITIVNVALPAIQRDLGSSFEDLQWVVDAYALTLAALLLTSGSLADRLGRRRVFAAGLSLFTVASLLCGLAGTPDLLTAARAVQGVGGAVMFATSLSLLATAFSGRERGTAFGAWGATTGAAVAVGPLVGGALTEGLGWEWIFFLNLPIGVATLAVTMTRLRESRDPGAGGVDLPGVLTFSSALGLLVFALIRGNAEGWGSPLIVSMLAGAGVLLVAFVIIEARRADPMLEPALFRRPAFAGASAVAFALSASMFAMFLYIVLYLQNVLGYSALQAGLIFLPVSLLSFLVAPVAGKLSARLPVRWFMGGGLALVGVGLLLMSGLEPGDDWTALLAGFVVAGTGVGLVNPPLASAAVAVVEPERSGMASGINTTFRQVGIATGIAGLGALFQGLVGERREQFAAAVAQAAPAGGGASPTPDPGSFADFIAFGGGGELAARLGSPAVARAAESAFLSGFNDLLTVGAVVAFAGALLAVVLVRQRDFVIAAAPDAMPA